MADCTSFNQKFYLSTNLHIHLDEDTQQVLRLDWSKYQGQITNGIVRINGNTLRLSTFVQR